MTAPLEYPSSETQIAGPSSGGYSPSPPSPEIAVTHLPQPDADVMLPSSELARTRRNIRVGFQLPTDLQQQLARSHSRLGDGEGDESAPQSSASTVVGMDIEHVHVKDDPRKWPRRRKLITLSIIAFTAFAPALAVNLYNPAFKQIESQLHASSSDISLSLSLFIIVNGNAPLFWSAISEIKGRKATYIVAMVIFAIGSTIAAVARNMPLLIAMRVFQAAGCSAAQTLGGGTLADVFDPHERGTIMGIYYSGPLLGPALGPIIGGLLTSAWSWRATFWFLVIIAGIALFSYVFVFKETFRRERSYAYQAALDAVRSGRRDKSPRKPTWIEGVFHTVSIKVKGTGKKISERLRGCWRRKKDVESDGGTNPDEDNATGSDMDDIRLTLADVSIIGSAWSVLRQKSNACTLVATGLTFAFQYGICYTAAITFSEAPYNYGPIIIGCILLAFGVGSVLGSVLGGRASDYVLRTEKKKVGGKEWMMTPEMRLRSTLPAMPLLPLSTLAYAWMVHFHVQIAGPVVVLFVAGLSTSWIYSSTLAYIVDANKGRSSTAVACNSSARGTMSFVVAEVSVPILNAIGDGGLYTGWAILQVVLLCMTILVMLKGAKWREEALRKEREREDRQLEADVAEDEKAQGDAGQGATRK